MMKTPSIALGTWSWGSGPIGGDRVFGNHLDSEGLKPVFEAAHRAGLNLWDTAPVYGMGASENILGSFVREIPREELLISTKFTPQIADGSDRAMENMFRDSCQRLGTDYIDLYWIHNPADVERWTPGLLPLLRDGRVKNVGVSNHNLAQLKRAEEILSAEGFRVSAVQNHFSLLYRSSEDAGILDYCRTKGITFYAYMVLEQGALTGRYDTKHPLPEGSGRGDTYNKLLPQLEELIAEMREMGERHGASVSQIAMAYAIAKGTLPLVGVTRANQVEEAASAARVSLSGDEVARLEKSAEKAAVDTRGAWEKPMTQ